MIRPLQDKVVVELDDSIPTRIAGFIIPIVTDRFRSKNGAIEAQNRGTVVSAGPGKQCPDTGRAMPKHFDAAEGIRTLRAGDIVFFSELEFYEFRENGKRYAVISDADVIGVEVIEDAAC
jgi:co-chaperonin GroES (HSP10)